MRQFSWAGIISILALPSLAFAGECTVLMSLKTEKTFYQSGDICSQRYAPASTFKIPLALMGFESGILKNPQDPVWSYEEGMTLNQETDKLDTTPSTWLKNSVVWYSQKMTALMGQEKFHTFVNQFDYGNKDISGDKDKNNGLSRSWLMSSLLISPVEQIQFLKQMLKRQFPLKPETYDNTLKSTAVWGQTDGWTIYGKTGSGWQKSEKGENKSLKQGWFVGWAEKEGETIVFSRLIADTIPEKQHGGWRARDSFLAEFPELMKEKP